MSNITIENVDLGSVVLRDARYRPETLTFPGADVYVAGTILARQEVDTAITPVADEENTGDGTVTAASVAAGPEVPISGNWILRCTDAATNGGTFRLEDPNGKIVATGLTMAAGAGASTVFEVAGLQFTVTDGDTDFAAGDFFTLPVVANGKLVVCNPAGAGGAQKACAVLTYPVEASGAGNVPIRALVAGEVNLNRLVLDGGGSVTPAIVEQLRLYGILATKVSQLAKLDNQ